MEKIVAVWSVCQTIKPTHAAPLGILGKFPVIRQNKQSHVKGLCKACPEEHQVIYGDCLLDKFLMTERAKQDRSYTRLKPWHKVVILKDRYFRYLNYLDTPGAERPQDPPYQEVKKSETTDVVPLTTIQFLIDEAYKFPPGFTEAKKKQVEQWLTHFQGDGK